MDASYGFQERLINDVQCISDMCLVAATPMRAAGGVSASIVSRCEGEELHYFHSGWSSPCGIASENLQGWCASPAATFCLAVGTSF